MTLFTAEGLLRAYVRWAHRGIVHEHGGEILCHNNTDGEGATFIVRLPALSETASVGAAAGVTQR